MKVQLLKLECTQELQSHSCSTAQGQDLAGQPHEALPTMGHQPDKGTAAPTAPAQRKKQS